MSESGNRSDASFMRRAYKGTAFLLGAQGGRLIFQAGSLFLAARWLGAANLGALSVMLALANILRPFSGFGYHVLVIQEVTRDSRLMPRFLSQSIPIFACGGFGLGLALVFFILPLLHLQVDLAPAMILLISELFLGGLFHFLCNSWQAEENFLTQALCYFIHPALRLVFILALALTDRLSLFTFALAHGSSLFLMVIPCFILRFRSWGLVKPGQPAEMLSNIKRGLPFAFGALSLILLPEIDKILMPRLAGLSEAGQYAIGIKVVNFAALPFAALLFTFVPRFFRDGTSGSKPGLVLTKRAWKLTIPYAVITGGALALLAPLVLPLLGAEYIDSPVIIRLGVGILLLQALHLPAGDALNGSGQAKWRAISQLIAAILAGVVAYYTIPLFGWRGALFSAYSGHGLLVILLVARLYGLASREQISS